MNLVMFRKSLNTKEIVMFPSPKYFLGEISIQILNEALNCQKKYVPVIKTSSMHISSYVLICLGVVLNKEPHGCMLS